MFCKESWSLETRKYHRLFLGRLDRQDEGNLWDKVGTRDQVELGAV